MKKLVVVALATVVVIAAVAVGVVERVRRARCRPPTLSVIDDPADLDDLHLELVGLDTESWVRQHDPGRTSPGYNLILFRRRVPAIIDMDSRIVHLWPEVRATGRVRLNRDGSLAVIGTDNLIKEYTWDGELAWHYQLPDAHYFPHHDLVRLRNDHYLVLIHDGHSLADSLYEVDRSGEVVWKWSFEDHVEAFASWDPTSTDPSHANSINELPPNRWFDSGDARFRPGNILVSARTLNTVFIIDKASGEVVWSYANGLEAQHEALMLKRGLRGAGLIMVFNNGHSPRDLRRSKVLAINPVANKVVWQYGSDFFFSSIGGTAQPLTGGNVLVTSSHGGRVFEIKSRGRIVWEWVPSYLPMRVERVAYDHCPQLAALPVPADTAVKPADRRPFVDADLYQFDFRWKTEQKALGSRKRRLLSSPNECRNLRLPVGATVRAEFGLDREYLGGRPIEARFRLTIDDHEQPPQTLIDTVLDETADPPWRRQTVSLASYALRDVSMCVEATIDDENADVGKLTYWVNPQIQSKAERERRAARAERITEQERKLREQQLKALGYVD